MLHLPHREQHGLRRFPGRHHDRDEEPRARHSQECLQRARQRGGRRDQTERHAAPADQGGRDVQAQLDGAQLNHCPGDRRLHIQAHQRQQEVHHDLEHHERSVFGRREIPCKHR